jgi:glycerol-3-phosphate dehydrogenase (NAD(P)+)
MRIAVLGAGSWGTTLAILLAQNGHAVSLWSYEADHAISLETTRENTILLPGIRIPDGILITHDLDRCVVGASMIVTAVPAQFLRSVLVQLRLAQPAETVFVNVAKGIENRSLMTVSELIRDVLPGVPAGHICTLSGPSFAEEVAKGIPTAVVGASQEHATAMLVQKVFMRPYFRVYSSEDIRGVELGGSIKNVIAIGAGLADGAGFGDNTKAAIMVRATAEISRLGLILGANAKTFAGLSGIGDLIATCMSSHSRNRYVGVEVGKGRPLADVLGGMVMVAEGVATTQSVQNLARRHDIEMPIVNQVYQVLFEGKDPIRATFDLMTRDAKVET